MTQRLADAVRRFWKLIS